MPVYAERNPDGSFEPITLATGQSHEVRLRVLELDHRYHDDDPVHEATYVVKFSNGYEVSGKLDADGKARLVGVPGGQAEVRYGPDTRPFKVDPEEKNPDYRPTMSGADIDALFAKHGNG